MQGLVTIAIPAYKRRWLAEAIDSALAQDYKNIELVIVNDHSPQNLDEVVEPYLSDPRVRYYVNEQNLGKESIVHNWNRCLELARGEYFVLLCDDDVMLPGFITNLVSLSLKYPECNVFHARKVIFKDGTNEEEIEQLWIEYETFESFIKSDVQGLRAHTVSEFLYRTKHIKGIQYFVTPLGWGADEISLLQFMKSGGIASSSAPLIKWRLSDEHLSHPGKRCYEKAKARVQSIMWYKDNVPEKLGNHPANDIIDCAVTYEYERATLIDRFRIILFMPRNIWPIKNKCYKLMYIWK